ncbi:MAG TPA: MarR family transcriptional regulator [Clostridiales bacterium]|nr:MarR family transcriptional regulator [Clostridiales bacterium]HRT82481.1 MarR family transcriptional regulator [Oscillospiraceae bacterium]
MNYSDEACIKIDFLMQKAMADFSRIKTQQFASQGLTSQQVSVLLLLDKHGPLKVSSIAENLNMADSNVSNICSRLEKMDLVERKRTKEDMRTVFVGLTEQSNEKIKDVKKSVYDFRLRLSESLKKEDFDDICKGLTKLNELLELFNNDN